MKFLKGVILLVTVALIVVSVAFAPFSKTASSKDVVEFKLGNEVLLEDYYELIAGKKVGLITNQSGVNSKGELLIDILAKDENINLVALYSPEHGIEGIVRAGGYVESHTHPELNIPVYSLYGPTRKPTQGMLEGVDLLLFDIQDVGSRTYTYVSTMNYCMIAAAEVGKPIIVLDRPNPVGGLIVDGPVLEEPFRSFVGVDKLPMAHGMTAGELAKFFNREINADLKVIPMKGYTRNMIFQDTGLNWVQTSPNIPDIDSLFGYMATGLGEGTGIGQADKFKWIGGRGIDSVEFARLLNNSGLPGIEYIPEDRGESGGVRLKITDYHTFNPARSGYYALAYAKSLNDFNVPKSGGSIVMFDKIMGTDRIGKYLEEGLSPQEIEERYAPDIRDFLVERRKYLIYEYNDETSPGVSLSSNIPVFVNDKEVVFDAKPHIDENGRLMVPIRAIVESLGAVVDWDGEKRLATITKGDAKLVLLIDSYQATLNGEAITMDTRPIIKESRTMVPARYIGEYLGSTVDWDPYYRMVFVD